MKEVTIKLSDSDYEDFRRWTEDQFGGDFSWSFKWVWDSHRGMVFDGVVQLRDMIGDLYERVSSIEKHFENPEVGDTGIKVASGETLSVGGAK